MIRVKQDTARHQFISVANGTTTVYHADLTPGSTVYRNLSLASTVIYTPGVAGVPPAAIPREWADGTDRVWADGTTREWAA